MKVSASVANAASGHRVVVSTNDTETTLDLPTKSEGRGSLVNGGELLFLALATCYCNDVFREAERLNIAVHDIEVSVDGEFGGRGDPARNVSFDVRISADASTEAILELLQVTDSVAEIQNTLRQAVPVSLRHTAIEGLG